jgi:ubiquinone/menaquinone biosynthesis C-methylase UbiE
MNDFKEFERLAWEQKASRYEDTWGSVTQQVIPFVLERAHIQPGDTLFDCGCGPGHLCHAAALRGASVIGGDASHTMIQIASSNYPNLRFQYEDAEQLSFHDATFSVVMLNYLLLHVAHQRQALSETVRILKPGGRLIFTLWQPPQRSPGFALIFSAIQKFADTSVIPPAEDVFQFTDTVQIQTFLKDQGFVDSTIEQFDSSWHVAHAESFFQAIQAGTRMGGMIELQKPEVKEQIRTEILSGLEAQFRAANGFMIPTPSLVVHARKKHL